MDMDMVDMDMVDMDMVDMDMVDPFIYLSIGITEFHKNDWISSISEFHNIDWISQLRILLTFYRILSLYLPVCLYVFKRDISIYLYSMMF